MIIIETPIFTKLITGLMSDDEYKELQEALVTRPEMGALIKTVAAFAKYVGRWKAAVKAAACG